MSTERKPWICPACGTGCAPHADTCGVCAMKALMRPLEEALKNPPTLPQPFEPFPVEPWYPTVPGLPTWPAPYRVEPIWRVPQWWEAPICTDTLTVTGANTSDRMPVQHGLRIGTSQNYA